MLERLVLVRNKKFARSDGGAEVENDLPFVLYQGHRFARVPFRKS